MVCQGKYIKVRLSSYVRAKYAGGLVNRGGRVVVGLIFETGYFSEQVG